MNKEIIKPAFETVFAEGLPNSYIIGITDQSKDMEKEIVDFLDSNSLHRTILLENGILTADINEKLYQFDISEHLNDFLARIQEDHFLIVFGFLDEELKPRTDEMKAIKFDITREAV